MEKFLATVLIHFFSKRYNDEAVYEDYDKRHCLSFTDDCACEFCNLRGQESNACSCTLRNGRCECPELSECCEEINYESPECQQLTLAPTPPTSAPTLSPSPSPTYYVRHSIFTILRLKHIKVH